MKPFIFHYADIYIPSFFFMTMIGSLAAAFYASWFAKHHDGDPVIMLDFGIIGIIAGVLGARIFHILIENPKYYFEDPIRVFYFWQGGFVSLGAFVFSAITWILYLHVRKFPVLKHFDHITLSVPIIIFFVRLGCLLAGCCYGKPTDFFLHLIFTDPSSAAGKLHSGEALHATQVYFMLNAVVMFIVLHLTYRYRRFQGQVLTTFLIYYGITRFLIEFLRGDADRGVYFDGMISTGQIVMVISFGVGIFLWKYLKKRFPV